MSDHIYFHVSEQRIIPILLKFGLLMDCALGERRIWLCSRYKLGWAYRHVARHHGAGISEMGHVRVRLPPKIKNQLHHFRKGIHFLKMDIPAEYLEKGEDNDQDNLCARILYAQRG